MGSYVPFQCDPNLQVFNVFIDNLDTRLPRIALFSTRTINAGEELTFDYQMKGMVFKYSSIGVQLFQYEEYNQSRKRPESKDLNQADIKEEKK